MSLLFWILLSLFVVLNILDAHSTIKVVSNGSERNEFNPIARFLFKKIGLLPGIIILKSIILLLIYLVISYYKYMQSEIYLILIFANLIYALVVIHNYRTYRKIMKYKEFKAELDIKSEPVKEESTFIKE